MKKCTMLFVHSFKTHTRIYLLSNLSKQNRMVLTLWRWWSSEEDICISNYSKIVCIHSFGLFVSYVSTVITNSMVVVILCMFVTVFPAFSRVQDYRYMMNVEETHRPHRSVLAGRSELTQEVWKFSWGKCHWA